MHSIRIPDFSGAVVTPEDAAYEETRAIWNGQIPDRPAVFAPCANGHDVAAALAFAAAEGLGVSVRGGGHNVAGHSLADGGLVIDLSGMRPAIFDESSGLARAGGGALLGDLDRATLPLGVIVPSGIVTDTGIGGLTLGGGIGWATRRFGLTCDQLVSVDLVTADGGLLSVDDENDPELMWGLRGAGANFGVVTEFRFSTHPLPSETWAGFVVYHLDEGESVLEGLAGWAADASDEVTTITFLRLAPPVPWMPPDLVGTPVVMLGAVHAGSVDDGEAGLSPLLALGTPLVDTFRPTPFMEHQAVLDAANPSGNRYYWRSEYVNGLTGRLAEIVTGHARALPTPRSFVALIQVGGAAVTPPVPSCVPMRQASFLVNYGAQWTNPAEDTAHRDWTRQAIGAVTPLGMGGGYTNFEAEAAAAQPFFSPDVHDRLAVLKQRMDPTNTFSHNLNIEPAAAGQR